MASVIKVDNLSKQYRLGVVGSGTMRDDLTHWWYKIRGKENPFLQIGEVNDRTNKGLSDYVWALKDINFEVQEGEILGIIGRNGAGKSTLLKILSQVTAPTKGSIKIRGRVASLLEVGTGFHPELTGRENIFLNGSILGMRKHEIKSKFDEIIDFAGVDAYVDTPVKRYSSGMYVRLAFAVAAYLDPEIMIVDEVLAVGDAEFQKKCMDRMSNLSRSEGKTILFVSHNLQAIKNMCHNGIYLKNGKIDYSGKINDTIDYYINSFYLRENNQLNPTTDKIQLLDVKVGIPGKQTNALKFNETLVVDLKFRTKEELIAPYFWVSIDSNSGSLFGSNSFIDNIRPEKLSGEFSIRYEFPGLKLLPQDYAIHLGARMNDGHTFLMTSMPIASFSIVTSVAELGFNSPFAEHIAKNASPILSEYSVYFNNEPHHFNPNLLCSKES